MNPGSSRPDWVPPDAGGQFNTRIIPGLGTTAPAATPARLSARHRVDDAAALAAAITAGDRGALARGITLIESRAAGHQLVAGELLRLLTPAAGGALRVGITGAPGAGKSTFIDALGTRLCAAGSRVAVLSVDPSSPVTHGSILGDKTRMETLSRHPAAFIRPSPSGCELGGVARRTRESIALCEAAGFNVVLVETVGVGQSEVMVRGMVDCFVVLLIAGAGDELQGIKKGIIELADLLVVNKAEGENRLRAEAAQREFARAIHYLTGEPGAWQTRVLTCSACTGEGIDGVWSSVGDFFAQGRAGGELAARRRTQAQAWLDALITEGLREAYVKKTSHLALQAEVEAQVRGGLLPAPEGVRRLLAAAGFIA